MVLFSKAPHLKATLFRKKLSTIEPTDPRLSPLLQALLQGNLLRVDHLRTPTKELKMHTSTQTYMYINI